MPLPRPATRQDRRTAEGTAFGMITEIDDYFAEGCGRCDRFATPGCSTRAWAYGLRALRRICQDEGLAETVKWGHPCYVHAGRNIAIIGAFRSDFRLSVFNSGPMHDPAGMLECQGPNNQHPDMIRFTDSATVSTILGTIRAYLEETTGYAEAGLRPSKDGRPLDRPDELTDALDAGPVLAEAFQALSAGRQRSNVVNLSSAEKAETRRSRIATFRSRILAGKDAKER